VTADKPESQEICFVPGGDYRAELRTRGGWTPVPGPVLDADGTTVGQHAGAGGFTVGQRKGLGVALGEPRFVSRIDPVANLIVLGRRQDLETREVPLEAASFIDGRPPAGPPGDGPPGAFRAQVRIRHRAPLVDATVRPVAEGHWAVATDVPVWAIAPGQACVLYDGEVCLGGGRIASPAAAPAGAPAAAGPAPAGAGA
jgi:tRNA-specific 2-thiouridylase